MKPHDMSSYTPEQLSELIDNNIAARPGTLQWHVAEVAQLELDRRTNIANARADMIEAAEKYRQMIKGRE